MDEITQLTDGFYRFEQQILDHLNQVTDHNYDTTNIEKYSPDFIQQQWQNYINSDKSNNDPNTDQYNSLANRIKQNISQLNTDKHDHNKVADTLKDRIDQSILPSNPNNSKPINWNPDTWNYNQYKPWDGITSPDNARTMALDVMKWEQSKQDAENFENKYSQPSKYSVKTQLPNGRIVYIPAYVPNKLVDAGNGMTWQTLHSGWNDYEKYLNNYNNADLYNKMTNNMYNHLWDRTYNNANAYTKQHLDNNFLNDQNDHPINDYPADQDMTNADAQYQYQIQKDRIWQQYHQNQLNYMNSYVGNADKSSHNILSHGIQGTYVVAKYDRTTFWGLGKKYHIPWRAIAAANPGIKPRHIPVGYHVKIPGKKSSSLFNSLNGKVHDYSPGGKYYNLEVRLRNKWKAKADQLNGNLENIKRQNQSKALLNATISNLKSDSRYTHFGYIRPTNPGTEDSYVFFMITSEAPDHENEPSSTSVEWGRNITTTTQKQPTTVSIEGKLFNNNLPKSAEDGHASQEPNDNHGLYPVKDDAHNISNWDDWGAEVYYSGIDMYPHCTITSFNPTYNNAGDGSLTTADFSMTLQVTDYFKSNTAQKSKGKSKDKGHKSKRKGKNSTKKHRRRRSRSVRIKAGMTFCGVSQKTGVPVSKLESLNKGMRARDLRIGARMKV